MSLKTLFLEVLLCSFILAAQSKKDGTVPVYESSQLPKIDSNSTQGDKNYKAPYFPILNWTQYENNPILEANKERG